MAVTRKKTAAKKREAPAKKKRDAKSTVSLPTEKSVPLTNLGDFSILLYGREKVGKSSLAAQFPDALFLAFEPGLKALSVYSMEMRTWADFVKACQLLEESDRFQTVVIDTVDLAYDRCMDYVGKKHGFDHPGDENDYGASWKKVRTEFTRWVSFLQNIGRGVIFISHSREVELKTRGGRTSHRIQPSMSGQAAGTLEPMVDIWAYYAYDDDGGRQLYIRGTDLIAAGCRLVDNFKKVDTFISMGASPEEAFKHFTNAFDNKATAARSGARKKVARKPRRKQ